MSFLAKHQSNEKQQSNEKKLKSVKGHNENLFLNIYVCICICIYVYILDSKGQEGRIKENFIINQRKWGPVMWQCTILQDAKTRT